MDIKKAREIMGETNIKYSDDQILQLIGDMRTLASICIDRYQKITLGERKQFKKKY